METKETKLTATQLARSLSDVLNRVQYKGERFIVDRNGRPVATLGPAQADQKDENGRGLDRTDQPVAYSR